MNETNRDSGRALVRVKSDGSCPFCGGTKNRVVNQFGDRFIMCLACRACGPECGTAKEAKAAWVERFSSAEAEAMCYLISDGMGHLKIGVSSDPDARLAALQTANPYQLTIVGTIHGGYETESALHERYASLRCHGEWFTDCHEIRAEFGDSDTAPGSVLSVLVKEVMSGAKPGLSRITNDGDLAIASTLVRSTIANVGRSPAEMVGQWVRMGFIRRWPEKITRQYRIGGERVRCYCVRRNHIPRLVAL